MVPESPFMKPDAQQASFRRVQNSRSDRNARSPWGRRCLESPSVCAARNAHSSGDRANAAGRFVKDELCTLLFGGGLPRSQCLSNQEPSAAPLQDAALLLLLLGLFFLFFRSSILSHKTIARRRMLVKNLQQNFAI